MKNIVPCFVCGKELDAAFSEFNNQPHDATAFRSYGHYGSTFFDPMNNDFIELSICDSHLEERIARLCHGAKVTHTDASKIYRLDPLSTVRGYTPEEQARLARRKACPDCLGYGWRYGPESADPIEVQCETCY
jgi:hypothetical protein